MAVSEVDGSSSSWFFLDFTELPLGSFGDASSPFSKGSVSSDSESNCWHDLRFLCDERVSDFMLDDGVFLFFLLSCLVSALRLCPCCDQEQDPTGKE